MTRLEKATNVAIILACAALVGNLAWNYYKSSRPVPPPPPPIAKGTEVKLPGTDLAGGQPAAPILVMALSKNCRFCQESVGFYQKLTAFKNSSPQGLRLVAALPDTREEAEAYLKENGIEADAILSMPVTEIGVTGTPTLLLLDGQRRLEEMWVGKLNESQESEVIARLKKACSGCSLPKVARTLSAGQDWFGGS